MTKKSKKIKKNIEVNFHLHASIIPMELVIDALRKSLRKAGLK